MTDQPVVEKEERVTEMTLHTGTEPSFKGMHEASRMDIIRALNWYALNKTRDDSISWFIKKFPDVSKDAIDIVGNAGFLIRMADRGMPYDDAIANYVMKRYHEAVQFTNDLKNTPKVEKHKVEKSEIVRDDVLDSYIEQVDLSTDQVIITGKGEVPVFGDMTTSQRKLVVSYIKSRIEEIVEDSKHEESGYSGIRQTNALVKILTSILTVIDKTVPIKQRKPRAKKPVSPDRLLRKFKSVKLADGVKLAKLIGAKGALVYDEARRKIVFFEGTSEGLSVKGASIINVSNSSMSKNLRNPEEQLKEIKGHPFRTTQKLITDINSKAQEPRTRGNENWTILAIF